MRVDRLLPHAGAAGALADEEALRRAARGAAPRRRRARRRARGRPRRARRTALSGEQLGVARPRADEGDEAARGGLGPGPGGAARPGRLAAVERRRAAAAGAAGDRPAPAASSRQRPAATRPAPPSVPTCSGSSASSASRSRPARAGARPVGRDGHRDAAAADDAAERRRWRAPRIVDGVDEDAASLGLARHRPVHLGRRGGDHEPGAVEVGRPEGPPLRRGRPRPRSPGAPPAPPPGGRRRCRPGRRASTRPRRRLRPRRPGGRRA